MEHEETHTHSDKHGHTHGTVDATLFTTQKGLRAVMISFIILFVGALFQLVVVLLSGSVSLLSDTIHNFGDGATAIPLSIAFLLARKKPTPRFNYGYGKAEDLAGVAVLLFMTASAIYAAYVSITRLYHPYTPTHLWIVAIASLVGFGINEAVALYRLKIGREIKSEALIADGKHARIDGITSLTVLIGAFGAYLGFPIADPLVGLFITILILHTVWESSGTIFTRLLDGVDPDIAHQVKHAVSKVKEVDEVRGIHARWLGHMLSIELTICVNPNLSVTQGHAIVEQVHHELHEHFSNLSHLAVHVDPH
ncbi:MAG TPA: cation diffusion facilitator family transporter [Candidatus Saccharimonadales bacterium]|nr:cation diffusion facilitator family transporter [Candidatus Saccharimonadales bacterium]